MYIQGHGTVCERCGLVKDSPTRLCILDAGSAAIYLCSVCTEDINKLQKVRITHPSTQWKMSRIDLLGWVDPAWRRNGPDPNDLREKMSDYDEKFRVLGKDFLALTNGYTDRGKFWKDHRQTWKDFMNVIDAYLKKTT